MKYFTLNDMLGLVKDDNGWTNTTNYDERIKAAARKAVGQLERKADFEWTVQPGQIVMVKNQELYACPYDFRKEVEGTVHLGNEKITATDLRDIAHRREGDGKDPGTPLVFAVSGLWPVHTQPSAASTVTFVSDSSADTQITVTVCGNVDGLQRYEIIVLDGATAVTCSLAFTKFFEMSKGKKDATGVMTASIGGSEIVAVPPQAKAMAFKVFKPEPIPDSAGTVTFDYYRSLGMMLQLGEAMPVPSGFEDVLWARISMYVDKFRRDYQAHRVDAAEYLTGIDELGGQIREPTGLVHPAAR